MLTAHLTDAELAAIAYKGNWAEPQTDDEVYECVWDTPIEVCNGKGSNGEIADFFPGRSLIVFGGLLDGCPPLKTPGRKPTQEEMAAHVNAWDAEVTAQLSKEPS